MSNIVLPTAKSGITKKWNDQKFLMIGSAGIGKSEFWAHAQSPLYIEAEAGLNFIDAYKMPCTSWSDIHLTMGALIGAKGEFPYDVVIIDTIDRVLSLAEQEVLLWARDKYRNGADFAGIGDIPEGNGWFRREGLMNKFLRGLEVLPCAKVVIGHIQNQEIKPDGGLPYHKSTISIGGKVGTNILAWSDHTLHVVGKMMGDQLKRTVYTKPTQSREAKSRGGVVTDGWSWGPDSSANFKTLRKMFD